MRDLGTLGGFQSFAIAINESGNVIGTSDMSRRGWPHHAFSWKDGRMRDLGTLGGSDSTAAAINDKGQIIGQSVTKHNALDGFLWETGKMRDLGRDREVHDINAHGQIVGTKITAFLWQKGAVQSLGTLGGATSDARKINDSGQIAGISTINDGTDRAFLWKSGKLVELPMVTEKGGVLPGCVVWAINQRGTVVGSCSAAAGTEQPQRDREAWSRAVSWTSHAAAHALGAPSRYSEAAAINSRGQIVGWSETSKGRQHAYHWQNNTMTDLGTLPGGNQSRATQINNRGEIIGVSTTKTGQTHAVLWTLRPDG